MSGITPETVTPEGLRAAAEGRSATWLPILASCGPMLADAIEIADSCARSDIECNVPCCKLSDSGFPEWYDLARIDPDDKEVIAQAVRYLTARGLIYRHPEHNEWVGFKR